MRGTVVDVERRTLPDGTVANVAVVGDAVLTMAEDGQVFTPGSTHCVSWPTVIHEEKPRYTQEGLRAKIQGTVEMEIVVFEDGTVGEVGVKKSLDTKYGLDQAAIAAAKNWRFKPGIRNGVPVPTRVGLILEFRLSK